MISKTSGIVLAIVGLLMLAYSSFTYYTTERVVDIGALKIDKQKEHFVKWPPVAGVILLVGGIIIISRSNKSNS